VDPSGDGDGGLTATGLLCGSCGTELPPNSKFCNECGAPVTEVSRSAEYKQVTVLFADVVHSMDIAAAVGAFAGDHLPRRRTGRWTAGETVVEMHPDQMLVVPPNTPHGFRNIGDVPLLTVSSPESGELDQTFLGVIRTDARRGSRG